MNDGGASHTSRSDQVAESLTPLIGRVCSCACGWSGRDGLATPGYLTGAAGIVADVVSAFAGIDGEGACALTMDICKGPTDIRYGPTDIRYGPTDIRYGPTDIRCGPTDIRYGRAEDAFGWMQRVA